MNHKSITAQLQFRAKIAPPIQAQEFYVTSTIESARQIQEQLVSIRRHLHIYPELNFAEYETSKFAAEKLTEMGFEVRAQGGNTGLVADLGQGDITVAIRCDMDAMPIAELNRAVFTSQKPGVMHACGHDANLTCALGAAKLLSEMDLKGRIRIIVQPGEHESGKPGATTMIEAGALEGVTAILGLHVDATVPTNKVGIVMGAVLPSSQKFSITFADASGEDVTDLSLAASKIVCALYQIPKSLNTSSDQVSVVVESMQIDPAGTDSQITGSVKTYSPESRQQVQEQINAIASGGKSNATVKFEEGAAPAVNSAPVTAIMNNAAVDLIGAANVLSIKRKSWNYQFLLFTEHVPGSMIYLGAEIAASRRIHQTATFDIDENCLFVGAAVLAETAARLLKGF